MTEGSTLLRGDRPDPPRGQHGRMPGDDVTQFQLAIPDVELDDLRARLRATRWPEPATDPAQGVGLHDLQALAAYWSGDYYWRRVEARLNEVGQFRTTIDGLGIHFLHARSSDPDALALVAHVAQHQWRWRYDENGNRVEDVFDPLAQVASQTKRYPLYHAKDGDRTADPPGVGNGYNFVPFGDPSSDIDFETFFARQGVKGYHNPNYEQDNAPGGPADPGRALRFTHFSAHDMRRLRG
jgi:YD repeat-containing protein